MQKDGANEKYFLGSVKNAIRILKLYSRPKQEYGITEIAHQLDIHKTTVHRLVTKLCSKGFLEQNPHTKRYHLGLSILGLSGLVTTHYEIYRVSLHVLKPLVDELGETAHLAILEDQHIVYLHKIECRHPVSLMSSIGQRNPALKTGVGKVILAYQPEEYIQHVIAKSGPYHCEKTEAQIRAELDQIKKQGYSIAKEEISKGIVSIGAPVKDYTGKVIAGISVVGPLDRIKKMKTGFLVDKIMKAAAEISENLGFYETKQKAASLERN
ncbi:MULTISPECIES: IclR family transcriptional regulator [Bacillus]|uniref:IclR family transcriptional regulator n=1 Tax=Bacillus TaxID=1386 RepID=UPI002E1A94BD|nr:IclR family transcriptional regulator [Bacillus smithii]MED1456982.1 IclR family transcriptional regulator [Bacillus smithii]MED4884494.1 IclR family transcriptional regulator [Bacillus smithii]MED4926345.1 IclR family transcriptional regulator [Bacillus smithii]